MGSGECGRTGHSAPGPVTVGPGPGEENVTTPHQPMGARTVKESLLRPRSVRQINVLRMVVGECGSHGLNVLRAVVEERLRRKENATGLNQPMVVGTVWVKVL